MRKELISGVFSYHAFCGSAYHLALEMLSKRNYTVDPTFWLDVFHHVKFLHDNTYTDVDEEKFAQQFCDPSVWFGVTIEYVIRQQLAFLRAGGFELIESEKYIRFEPGYDVPYFHGTLDMILVRGNKKFLVDSKTSGMWGRLKGQGIKKQSYTRQQVEHHLQLIHYSTAP